PAGLFAADVDVTVHPRTAQIGGRDDRARNPAHPRRGSRARARADRLAGSLPCSPRTARHRALQRSGMPGSTRGRADPRPAPPPRPSAGRDSPGQKFGQVEIYNKPIAIDDVGLRLRHRLVGGATWPEAVAVLAECRISLRLVAPLEQLIFNLRPARF